MHIPYKSFQVHPTNKLYPHQTELLRPVIQIELKDKEGKPFFYDVLVDSGADYCLFHASIAKQLGIDLKKGKSLGFYGTSGRTQVAYFHQITFSIQNQEVTTMVGFSTGIESMSVGLLGQNGFFDKFTVQFDLTGKKIILNLIVS